MTTPYCRQPCRECPWRRDVAPGKFSAARFRALANTAYDMARSLFACHMSTEEKPVACAGFLLRGADHNFTVRIGRSRGEMLPGQVETTVDLYSSYREMAIANGVSPSDPALRGCRP